MQLFARLMYYLFQPGTLTLTVQSNLLNRALWVAALFSISYRADRRLSRFTQTLGSS